MVSERDIDAIGHVNNAVWVRFIVELAEAAAHSRGFGADATRRLGGLWIVRRHEIDYLASAPLGVRLLEETWVSRMRGARSLRHARFSAEPGGAVFVEAVTQWAFVDPETLRPRRIPRELLAGFAPSEGPGAQGPVTRSGGACLPRSGR